MFKEFKAFAMRGNVIDLAVGVVLGAAFGTVVNSFVKDVLMQLVAALGNSPDFSKYSVHLGEATINYGNVVNAVVAFLTVAFALFLFVKAINRLLRPPGADAAPETRDCPYCTSAIALAAIRCPACTSDLTEDPKPKPARSRR
jgi:large conductance mechanosensitive channel